MATGYLELFVEQGETFDLNVSLDYSSNNATYDLTNYTAKSEIRRSPWSANASAIFQTSIDANTSSIVLFLSANTTQELRAGRYSYDIFLTNNQGTNRSKVLEGLLFVEPSTTRI